MHLAVLSTTTRGRSNLPLLLQRLVSIVAYRHVSSEAAAVHQRTSARSFLVRYVEDHRNKIKQEDIRLEPYKSKGVYTESGAIRPMPKRYPLGLVKVVLITIPFLYFGALVSKYGALVLEKMELFVYNDDDDDDDDD